LTESGSSNEGSVCCFLASSSRSKIAAAGVAPGAALRFTAAESSRASSRGIGTGVRDDIRPCPGAAASGSATFDLLTHLSRSIRLTHWLSEGSFRWLAPIRSARCSRRCPTRLAIIAELASRDASVTELTAPLSISMPAVSRHLKVLERAALISRSRSGKWRASRLEAAPLREAADWIERYRRFWDSSLTRLDAHLAAVQAAERATDRMVDDTRELE